MLFETVKFTKQLTRLALICQVCIFRIFKTSKVVTNSIFRNSGLIIFFTESMGTFISRIIIGLYSSIHSIIGVGRFSKVGNSIVTSNKIAVIDLVAWPSFMGVEPCKSVCQILFLIYPNIYISRLENGPSLLAGFASTAGCFPVENPSMGIKIQKGEKVGVSEGGLFVYHSHILKQKIRDV